MNRDSGSSSGDRPDGETMVLVPPRHMTHIQHPREWVCLAVDGAIVAPWIGSAQPLGHPTVGRGQQPGQTPLEPDPAGGSLEDIHGVGPVLADRLSEAGFDSIEAVAVAGTAELTTVDGVGEDRAGQLQAAACRALGVAPSDFTGLESRT